MNRTWTRRDHVLPHGYDGMQRFEKANLHSLVPIRSCLHSRAGFGPPARAERPDRRSSKTPLRVPTGTSGRISFDSIVDVMPAALSRKHVILSFKNGSTALNAAAFAEQSERERARRYLSCIYEYNYVIKCTRNVYCSQQLYVHYKKTLKTAWKTNQRINKKREASNGDVSTHR